MPPPPPAGATAWEQEEYRLWLGSIGYYGKQQSRYYSALLAAHRAMGPEPSPPAPVPAPQGVITGPDGLRTLDGWPEWSPGVFGPVPIGVVEAVERGEMRRNPQTGFYERVVSEDLLRRWATLDPDAVKEVEDFLPGIDELLRGLLPEPARTWWIREYADFVEGRMPIDRARGFVALVNRHIAYAWGAVAKTRPAGVPRVRVSLSALSSATRRAAVPIAPSPALARRMAEIARHPLYRITEAVAEGIGLVPREERAQVEALRK